MGECCCGNTKPIEVYVELIGKQDYHVTLKGRDEPNQHPITAITNLRETLDGLDDNIAEVSTRLDEEIAAREKIHIENYYDKEEIDEKIDCVLRYKGQVTNYDALPITGNVIGDVYNVVDTGANYVWTGNSWDDLSPAHDLSNYVTKDYLESSLDTTVRLIQDHLNVHYYNKSEVDSFLSTLNDSVNFLDNKIDNINSSLSHNINELDTKLTEHITNTYTKDEVDTLLSTKADLSDAEEMQDQVDAIEDTISQIQVDIQKIKIWNDLDDVINE